MATARTLDDFADCGGLTAVFNAGTTALGHHWRLVGQDGSELARTIRTHTGGKVARAWWKAVTLTGMDVNNDIHVELVGADGTTLARASSTYNQPTVTLSDPTGRSWGLIKRDDNVVTIYGPNNAALAEFTCDGDSPWPVRGPSGDVLGEVLAGFPGPSLSPDLWMWMDPQGALNDQAYSQTMHLGLRRVKQYSFAPTGRVRPILALLPLFCGLIY
jgi:hypothetical protein